LALAQEGKLGLARALLEDHGLAKRMDSFWAFPGGWTRQEWLFQEHDRIFARDKGYRRKRVAGDAARCGVHSRAKEKPAPPREKMPPVPAGEHGPAASAAPAVPPGLPLIDIDIPFAAEIDLAPLGSALQKAPDQDGGWYWLRERFAHLRLAQGFDELLCLPHLHGIETFWYQVETVRKVLKQFRGRVLLADEVGLGKTVEAGMVLKEYLLRGMVESVLVLAPASLVGQWREESSTFPAPRLTTISCAPIRIGSGRRNG
jgi:hypothetical protein